MNEDIDDKLRPPSFIAKEQGNLIIVQVFGAINSQTLPQSQKMIDELIQLHNINERSNLSILVDYQYVTDSDSSTVANFLMRIEEGQALFHRIAFINLPNMVLQLIEIHKLQETFKIYPDEKSAIKDLTNKP